MGLLPKHERLMFGLGIGLLSGSLFTFLVGEFDPARYLVEQLTMIPFEMLFVTLAAFVTWKWGLAAGITCGISGTAGSFAFLYPAVSATSAVFVKTASMGVLIGESGRFTSRFTPKLAVAAIPGVILAGVIGLPIVYNGVAPGVIEDIRKEALDMYLVFMSPDNAGNAADNAIALTKGMFEIGFAILALTSIVVAWTSFQMMGWLFRHKGWGGEAVPPLSEFSLPFPVIWIFLASFGLVLAEPRFAYPVALNLLVLAAVLYGIQGIAVITHFMGRVAMGRLPRILFWLIFFITLAFSIIIFVFTGIIDNWFHLRSIPSAPRAAGDNEGTDDEGDIEGRR